MRASLADYYVNSTSVQAEHLFQYVPVYREHIRGIVPHRIQNFIWTNCHGIEGNRQMLVACNLTIEDSEARDSLEQIQMRRSLRTS